MKALISPNEVRETGYRVAEVEEDDKVFPVANPLFWVNCPDDLVADQKWYDPTDQQFKDFPAEPVAAEGQPITTGTQDV